MTAVHVVGSRREAGWLIAEQIGELVRRVPKINLGLATGSSIETVYTELDRQGVDLGKARGFALDEYIGLPEAHPQSYRSVLTRMVVDTLGLPASRLMLPDADHPELFDRVIDRWGGVDLQLLGIGSEGHIGFNEAGSSLGSRTRAVTLAESTRRDNARFFESVEKVPRLAVTQGVGTILRARRLVLLAFGASKAEAVAAALEGPITARVPASALQLHPDVTVVLDRLAAGGLQFVGRQPSTASTFPRRL